VRELNVDGGVLFLRVENEKEERKRKVNGVVPLEKTKTLKNKFQFFFFFFETSCQLPWWEKTPHSQAKCHLKLVRNMEGYTICLMHELT